MAGKLSNISGSVEVGCPLWKIGRPRRWRKRGGAKEAEKKKGPARFTCS